MCTRIYTLVVEETGVRARRSTGGGGCQPLITPPGIGLSLPGVNKGHNVDRGPILPYSSSIFLYFLLDSYIFPKIPSFPILLGKKSVLSRLVDAFGGRS